MKTSLKALVALPAIVVLMIGSSCTVAVPGAAGFPGAHRQTAGQALAAGKDQRIARQELAADTQAQTIPDFAGRAVAEGKDQRIARQELAADVQAQAIPDFAGRAIAVGKDQRIARQEPMAVPLTLPSAGSASALTPEHGSASMLGIEASSARLAAPAAENIDPGDGRQPKTWVIGSVAAFRLLAPPDRAATEAEIGQLKALAAQRDAAALQQIAYWDAGSPSYRWVQIALDQFQAKPVANPRIARAMALVNVAIYDALVAARDSAAVYHRPSPSEVDRTLGTVIARPQSRSYPSEHAVVAGAASTILGYLYPDDVQTFADEAQQAAKSRLLAGVAYPSDVKAGLELGQAVAQRVIQRAKTDGSDAKWTGSVPSGPGLWNGTNPIEPLAGTWQTWVLATGSELRPPAPPAYNSPQKLAELRAIETFTRTFTSNARAMYWQTFDGLWRNWYDTASLRLFEYRLDGDALRAARDYAAMSVAHYDAYVACWDAKYTYWAIRPFQLDPTLVTLFPTPNHPSYPSAHGCASGAIAGVMEYLYPAEAQAIHARANEAAASRLWAGIHYQSDIDAGLALGRAVAQRVIDRIKTDDMDSDLLTSGGWVIATVRCRLSR